MAEKIDPITLYRSRLNDRRCFKRWPDQKVHHYIRRGGEAIDGSVDAVLPRSLRIAHGLLFFEYLGGHETEKPEYRCLPWLVSPRAGRASYDVGRHSFVARELKDKLADVTGYEEVRPKAQDVCVGTYTIKRNEELQCFIPSFAPGYFKTDAHQAAATERIRQLSAELHMVRFCVEYDGEWAQIVQGEKI